MADEDLPPLSQIFLENHYRKKDLKTYHGFHGYAYPEKLPPSLEGLVTRPPQDERLTEYRTADQLQREIDDDSTVLPSRVRLADVPLVRHAKAHIAAALGTCFSQQCLTYQVLRQERERKHTKYDFSQNGNFKSRPLQLSTDERRIDHRKVELRAQGFDAVDLSELECRQLAQPTVTGWRSSLPFLATAVTLMSPTRFAMRLPVLKYFRRGARMLYMNGISWGLVYYNYLPLIRKSAEREFELAAEAPSHSVMFQTLKAEVNRIKKSRWFNNLSPEEKGKWLQVLDDHRLKRRDADDYVLEKHGGLFLVRARELGGHAAAVVTRFSSFVDYVPKGNTPWKRRLLQAMEDGDLSHNEVYISKKGMTDFDEYPEKEIRGYGFARGLARTNQHRGLHGAGPVYQGEHIGPEESWNFSQLVAEFALENDIDEDLAAAQLMGKDEWTYPDDIDFEYAHKIVGRKDGMLD